MKLFWKKIELEEKFILTKAEINLLSKRSNTNKLGMAVLLKYVQHERKFPSEKKEIPLDLVKYIGNQLNISSKEYRYYKLDLRNSEFCKQRYIIRKYYSLKSWNRKYVRELSKYLIENVIPNKKENKDMKQNILKYLYDNSIEPPSNKYLSRIINSSINNWESRFDFEIKKIA